MTQKGSKSLKGGVRPGLENTQIKAASFFTVSLSNKNWIGWIDWMDWTDWSEGQKDKREKDWKKKELMY